MVNIHGYSSNFIHSFLHYSTFIYIYISIYFDQFSTVDGYHIPSDDPAPRLSFTNFFGRSEQCVFEQISRQEVIISHEATKIGGKHQLNMGISPGKMGEN